MYNSNFVIGDRWYVKVGDTLIDGHPSPILEERPRPVIVCLCGSTRFKEAFEEANARETLEGRVVLSVGMFGHRQGLDMDGPVKKMLDGLHFFKIELADEVFVVNEKWPRCRVCGLWGPITTSKKQSTLPKCEHQGYEEVPYIGESTRREIDHATRLGKTIRYLHPAA